MNYHLIKILLTIDDEPDANVKSLSFHTSKASGVHDDVDSFSAPRLKKVGTQPRYTQGASGRACANNFHGNGVGVEQNKGVFQRWTPLHNAKVVEAARHDLFPKGLGIANRHRHRQQERG